MHALVIRGLRSYFVQVHGEDIWAKIARARGFAPDDFQLNIVQDETLAERFLNSGSEVLGRAKAELLEDFGLFLTTHDATQAVRRLMRFTGPDFMEFLVSLPDLSPRVEMAVPGLRLPRIDVADMPGGLEVAVRDTVAGFDHVLTGVIRGMADDYGALVHVEPTRCKYNSNRPDYTYLAVLIIEEGYSAGRAFTLVGES